jgi:hypothetical protein
VTNNRLQKLLNKPRENSAVVDLDSKIDHHNNCYHENVATVNSYNFE